MVSKQPIGPSYDYQPSTNGTVVPLSAMRVMMIEDLPVSEQVAIRKAIRRAAPRLPIPEPPPTVEGGPRDYYCFNGAQRDFLFDASKCADVTGTTQIVHMHSAADPCEGRDHIEVEPEAVRSRAVGGPEHRRTAVK